MIKKIKMYKFFWFSILLMLILIFISFFQFYKENFSYAKAYNIIKESCYEKKNPEHEYCKRFRNEENLEKYIIVADPKKRYEKYDAITLTCTIVENTIFNALQYFSPLIIAIAVIGSLHSIFTSGMFENYLLRLDYKKYLKKIYKTVLSSAFIMPASLIIIFVISSIFTGFNFDINNVDKGLAVYGQWKYENFLLYGFLICLLQYLISLLYANISLYCCKKNKNKVVAIIMSYIIFLIVDIVIYVVVYGMLLNNLFGLKEMTDYFNIAGYWFFSSDYKVIIPVLIAFVLQAISFIIVYLEYKKKEQVVLAYEMQVS